MKTINFLCGAITLFVLVGCADGTGSSSSDSGSGKAGSMARFAISGDHLYCISNYDLTTFDISKTTETRKVNSQYIQGFAETIFATDSVLYFGTREGMLIYDIQDPAKPDYISRYRHIYSCDPVVVSKSYAFVTLNSASLNCGRNANRLEIIDISDLKTPKLISEHEMTGPLGLGIDRDVLFVCDDGLKAFHITNFYQIDSYEEFDVEAYDVIPDNGYLMLIGEEGFHQYKYTERTLRHVSSIYTDN